MQRQAAVRMFMVRPVVHGRRGFSTTQKIGIRRYKDNYSYIHLILAYDWYSDLLDVEMARYCVSCRYLIQIAALITIS